MIDTHLKANGFNMKYNAILFIISAVMLCACGRKQAESDSETDDTASDVDTLSLSTETTRTDSGEPNTDDTQPPETDSQSDTGSDTGADTDTPSLVDANGIPVFDNCPVQQASNACEENWCRIEEGTFLYGTSPDAAVPCSNGYGEFPVQVTLTRPFLIQQHEVTQAQWEAMGFSNPARDVHPQKPITWINWLEAAAYCNALSQQEGLDSCYDLSACQGEVGTGCPSGSSYYQYGCEWVQDTTDDFVPDLYVCNGEIHRYPNYYECPGYRLPTAAEWQYAARACTSAATYNGDMPSDLNFGGFCDPVPTLDPIAWHCGNAQTLQIIKTRRPNLWNLYDMLGNAREYVDHQNVGMTMEYDEGKKGPLVDPIGDRSSHPEGVVTKSIAGGSYRVDACLVRPAYLYPDGGRPRGDDYGFRPVRTIFTADADSGK